MTCHAHLETRKEKAKSSRQYTVDSKNNIKDMPKFCPENNIK